MICERTVKEFCKDDITKIENYEQAINDKTQTWHCHHRLELTLDNDNAHSKQDLIRLGMYYNRPYFELIFLTSKEHRNIHNKNNEKRTLKMKKSKLGHTVTAETIQKMREAQIGKPRTEFGRKFIEHYGFGKQDNYKLYKYEVNWYIKHNKTCRWEAEDERDIP